MNKPTERPPRSSNGPPRSDRTGFETLRIRWWTTAVLWWHAVLDRRAGLPGPTAGDGVPPSTPCLDELHHRTLEVIESEQERLRERTVAVRRRLRRCDHRITEARRMQAAGAPLHSARLGELEATRMQLEEQVAQHCLAAQRRCLRFDEYTRRCRARYARTLVRRHPAGPALLERGWPAPGPLPRWVLAERPAVALFGAADADASAGADR